MYWGFFMRTIVYVDGFNLYYGYVKGTAYKWLDLGKLFSFLLPGEDIVQIRYFTARVRPFPTNPGAPRRQLVYLRALRTISNLSVHFGNFLMNPARLPKYPVTNPPKFVDVLKPEEKGTDVNLASYLLMDCVKQRCQQSVVVSADGDLALPLEMARQEGNRVGVLIPYRHHSNALRAAADYARVIRDKAVQWCQFNDELTDHTGKFRKPAAW